MEHAHPYERNPARGASSRGRGGGAAVLLGLALALGPGGPLAAQGVEIIMGTEKTRGGPAVTASGEGAVRATMRLLDDRRTEILAVSALTDTEVRAVQRALLAAGFDPGPYDGRMGPQVRAALGGFQEANGIEPCRCLDGETLDALGLRVRIVQTIVGDTPVADVEILMPRRPVREPALPEPPPLQPEDPEPDTTAAAALPPTAWIGVPWILPGGPRGAASRPAATGVPGRPLGGPAPGRLIRGRGPGSGGSPGR